MTKTKILIISASEIVPTISGGTVHTAGVSKSLLRQGYEVRIYCLAGRKESYSKPKTDSHRQLEIEPGLTQEIHLGLLFGLLQTVSRRLGMPRIWQFWLMRMGWVPKQLKQAAAWADAIICDMPHTPPLRGDWGNKPWYLMSHDLTWRQLEQSEFKVRLWTGWMRRVEASAPQRYSDIIAVTTEDQSFFRDHDQAGKCLLPIIGSSVDPENYNAGEDVRAETRAQLNVADDERLILFSGSFFGPNIVPLANILEYCAAKESWLAEQRLRVLILGSIEPEAYTRGQVIATGRVPSITPYFAAADAGFNPVLSGSGANVKLFEYLAARLPVISTEFGVRGSELVAEKDFIVCDTREFTPAFEAFLAKTPDEWAQYCEQVWQRHRHYCDIGVQTEHAVAALPNFPSAV